MQKFLNLDIDQKPVWAYFGVDKPVRKKLFLCSEVRDCHSNELVVISYCISHSNKNLKTVNQQTQVMKLKHYSSVTTYKKCGERILTPPQLMHV